MFWWERTDGRAECGWFNKPGGISFERRGFLQAGVRVLNESIKVWDREEKTVRNRVLRAGFGVVGGVGLALVVGAQGPPPGEFGRKGPGPGPGGPMAGSFEFGGLVGGFGGKTVTGKPFQAKFSITRTETLPNNSITNTTTGVVARDSDGSTYRDVTLPAIGPWASSGKPQEFVY